MFVQLNTCICFSYSSITEELSMGTQSLEWTYQHSMLRPGTWKINAQSFFFHCQPSVYGEIVTDGWVANGLKLIEDVEFY